MKVYQNDIQQARRELHRCNDQHEHHHPDPQRPRQPDRESSRFGSDGVGGGHAVRIPRASVGMNPIWSRDCGTVLLRVEMNPQARSCGRVCVCSSIAIAQIY
jgi:hypothetical protein